MADPVAAVERIIKLGLAIKDAVDTVRHNEEECDEIRRRVLRFSAILSQLQQRGMMDASPAMSGALEDLEATLQRALQLVTACQEQSTIRRLIRAGDLSKQLRRVKDDIFNNVMLASFAINTQTTIVLLTIQAGRQPLPCLQEDTGMVSIQHNSHSANDARSQLTTGDQNNVLAESEAPFAPLVALRKFRLSELEAATNHFSYSNRIGQGGFSIVYKGVLSGGNVVCIKRVSDPASQARAYDQLPLVSKLKQKNIVRVLGYCHEVASYSHEVASYSSVMRRLFKSNNVQAKEREFFWVEEYMPNGSLDINLKFSIYNPNGIICNLTESQFDWPSMLRILEGIAQGLHYLHEHNIVHMDVKPSNILMDSDMNPKIADFGLSMVLDDDETTEHCVRGTMGYLPPEYAMHGRISMKNDVYAFGVSLLETIRGMWKPEVPREHPLYKWIWEAWEAGRIMEVFDPSLLDGSELMEIKRCVQVGLLCVQAHQADRPTMADVLGMLNGLKELPTPKTPAYIVSDERGPVFAHDQDEGPASPAAWSDGSCSPR